MSADIQRRRTPDKAALLEGRTREKSSCLDGQAAIRRNAPLPSPLQLSEHREMVNSHPRHWVSVQRLMEHHNLHHRQKGVCSFNL